VSEGLLDGVALEGILHSRSSEGTGSGQITIIWRDAGLPRWPHLFQQTRHQLSGGSRYALPRRAERERILCMALYTSASVSALNPKGMDPESSRKRMTPSAHTSAALV